MTQAKPAENPPPRFRQIVDDLRQKILNGTLSEHSALPSERSMAETYEVSRMTARRALEALEAEGLAYNEERKGRFVSPRRLRYNISDMVSFAADLQAAGEALEIEVLSSGSTHADTQLADALNIAEGTELLEYTRLFRIQGHATFLETEYVIASEFPGLLNFDLRQSSTKILEQHFDVHAHRGDIVIRMRSLDAKEAKGLGVSPHLAGIELEQVICDVHGMAFCFGRQIWRGELAEFSARAIVYRPDTPSLADSSENNRKSLQNGE